jgi:hypothetical protein
MMPPIVIDALLTADSPQIPVPPPFPMLTY